MDIILASASPRRKEILQNVNLKFKIETSDVDEQILENEQPISLVLRLALEKGMSISNKYPQALVISADTVVSEGGQILGKPKDEHEAKEMLSRLSGKTHQVITGISLIHSSNSKKIIDYVVSDVKFKQLSQDDIQNYINTNESLDKAGAYGIQGYGAVLVEEIKGDYFNIVGLPISKLSDLLKMHFDINVFTEGD